jgi:hypothetical protein
MFVRKGFSQREVDRELHGHYLPTNFKNAEEMLEKLDRLTEGEHIIQAHDIMPNTYSYNEPMLRVWTIDIVKMAMRVWSNPDIKDLVDTAPTSPQRGGNKIYNDFSSGKYAQQVSDALGGARFLPLGLFIDGKAVMRIGRVSIIGVYARIMWTGERARPQPECHL